MLAVHLFPHIAYVCFIDLHTNEIEGSSPPNSEIRKLDIVKTKSHVRFLGNTPASTVFLNGLTIVASIFVIWDFIETREDKKLPDNGELLDEWDSHLGGINSQLEDAKLTLKQLTCRLETIQSSNKAVSPECRQLINQYKTTGTGTANSYVPVAIKSIINSASSNR